MLQIAGASQEMNFRTQRTARCLPREGELIAITKIETNEQKT
jgi:hypothetical protein